MRTPSRIEVKNTSSQVEHEAPTQSCRPDFLQSAGLSTQDAINMIVNGYCREVFEQLPMEFAVEPSSWESASEASVKPDFSIICNIINFALRQGGLSVGQAPACVFRWQRDSLPYNLAARAETKDAVYRSYDATT